ncbi:MAG: class I SAM-dependent methyltransferase [Rhodospirillales bacterium]|jgi:demethylmenaquinone methyltransferase/2-methoxy-6-polyprenyl-1,4-benzoquinol methylase
MPYHLEQNGPEHRGPTVDFGFRDVPESEKTSLVRNVFAKVAPHYDLMNDLMSAGVHRVWKTILLDTLNPRPAMRLADIGGGTGDIALNFLSRGGGEATVIDINQNMLDAGRDRAINAGQLTGITWTCGDAESLPLDDGSVDVLSAAFSLRNVTRRDRALREAWRVLRPGGRFLCLEFGHVTIPWLAQAYDAYSFKVLPALGGLIAGDAEAYRYLAESIRRFPDQDAFTAMIADVGFERTRYRNLSGGIAVIFSAWRL